MKEKYTSLMKALEKDLTQYASKSDSGAKLTKDSSSEIASQSVALLALKGLSLVDDIRNHGLEKLMKHSGGDHHKISPMGFDSRAHDIPQYPWMAALAKRISPQVLPQMDEYEEHDEMEMRRGVPGTGTYGDRRKRRKRRRTRYEMDGDIGAEYTDGTSVDYRYDERHESPHSDHDYEHGDMEARRRRSKRTGRFIKSESDHDDTGYDIRHNVRNEVKQEIDRHAEHQRAINEAYARGAADMANTARSEVQSKYDATNEHARRGVPGTGTSSLGPSLEV